MQNIILFHGPNTFNLEKTLKSWIKAFYDKYNGDLNIEILDSQNLQMQEILKKAGTMPFLAEKRMVVIKNFLSESDKDEQKKLIENLNEIPDFTILIFAESSPPDKRTSLYKKLEKDCRVEFFEELEGLTLTNWILEQIKKHEGKISSTNANYLSLYVGNDTWQLSQEIQKLCLFASEKEITKEDIEKLSTPLLSTSIFKLTDAIGFKKQKEALNLLERIIQSGEELPMIFHMLVRQFRLIIMIKECYEQGIPANTIAKTLKQHPFAVSNILKQCQTYNFDELKKIYKKLLDIEIAFKTGKIYITTDDKRDFVLALEKFVMTS
ncbi:DNA polymerase III subunit delta [Candidatus Peregrinibacteria bacterium RIFOXYB2_FULL_32_7]|nr:MAG: DNA polymerase III subunit delta [Candidatus Peregrinibacteria bacterium RIFOXYB2_FULL_32_7]